MFFSLFACAIIFLPIGVFARPVSEIVDSNVQTVSRATFISWSVEAFGIPKEEDSCELPYARVPKALKPTLCTLEVRGGLDVFGNAKAYPLAQPISRGEALAVLTALSGKRETLVDISAFKDVRTEIEKQGVRNAISLKWMVPLRASLFGVARPLTGNEALSVLQKVSDIGASPKQTVITVKDSGYGTLPKQEMLDLVWQILLRDYIHREKIDPDEAAYRAAEAIVNSLGDPHTSFFRPVDAENFALQLSGELSGIGAQVEDKAGAIMVIAPIPGSPAERAGIMTGDQILEANGHVLTGIGLNKAVSLIRGERGTSVLLKIRRGGIDITLTVVRDRISIPEVGVTWQGGVAVIQLIQFGQTTDTQIRSIMTDVAKKNPKGVILDLRNNGGGYLSAAITVVSNFVPMGSVVANVNNGSQTKVQMTESEPTLPTTVKVVVLINKGSASASEIVAGALQDHKRATIVGETSFGKGTVQNILTFPTGEALKVTIAEWLTPLKRKIDTVGVKPDVVVDSSDKDAALRRALDILR